MVTTRAVEGAAIGPGAQELDAAGTSLERLATVAPAAAGRSLPHLAPMTGASAAQPYKVMPRGAAWTPRAAAFSPSEGGYASSSAALTASAASLAGTTASKTAAAKITSSKQTSATASTKSTSTKCHDGAPSLAGGWAGNLPPAVLGVHRRRRHARLRGWKSQVLLNFLAMDPEWNWLRDLGWPFGSAALECQS